MWPVQNRKSKTSREIAESFALLESVLQEAVMRSPMRLIVAGCALLCMGVAWLGVEQPGDGGDILKESTVGKIAWQYDTGG